MGDDTDMDSVFKALADPTRRTILDLLGDEPGMTLRALTGHFEVSRFAIMKHLKVLQQAGLVTDRRRGKHRELFLNAVPIQLIQDRWMSQHARRWAPQLTGLKHALEAQPLHLTSSAMSTPKNLYVIHIRTTAAALWEAITQPSQTQRFFYATAIEFRPEVGAPVRWVMNAGTPEAAPAITGEVIEVVPEVRLVHTFEAHFSADGEGMDDPPSTVTWEIETLGHVCKLTLTHEYPAENATYHSTKLGWFPVLSGLKTLLETGQPLDIPMG